TGWRTTTTAGDTPPSATRRQCLRCSPHPIYDRLSTVSIAPAVSAMSSLMWSIRARHRCSYWSSKRCTTSSASRLGRTILRRPTRPFVTRPAAFEDRDVLLDRCEAHRVVAGQLDDALLGLDGAADDVAPRVIGQSAEHAVEVGRSHLHRYNHMVV